LFCLSSIKINESVLCRYELESESELELDLEPQCEWGEESQVDFNEKHHCESDYKKIEFKFDAIKSNYESIVQEKCKCEDEKEIEMEWDEETDEEYDEEYEIRQTCIYLRPWNNILINLK